MLVGTPPADRVETSAPDFQNEEVFPEAPHLDDVPLILEPRIQDITGLDLA